MTVADAIAALQERLTSAGVRESRLIAEYAVAEIIGCQRLMLFRHYSQEFSPSQQTICRDMSERLARHEPLQYVLGYTFFYGRRFNTDQRALIPRPETEELVNYALSNASIWSKTAPQVIDVGTGSGCIAVTIAIEQPSARVTAIDSSADALALAAENAALHPLDNLKLLNSSLLEDQPENFADLIISNPPYIAHPEISELPANIYKYEPHLALDGGGKHGLDIIDELITQSARVLKDGGWIYLETGENQGDAIIEMLRSKEFEQIEVNPDFAERQRFAFARQCSTGISPV